MGLSLSLLRGITVDDDHVTALDALLSQDACENFDFIEKLGIGVFLGGVCHGGFPDDGDIVSMAGLDVAIDAIVCCGDVSIWEPGPGLVGATGEGLGLFSQSSRGLCMPVEPRRVMGPESFWVSEGVRMGCFLGHGCK